MLFANSLVIFFHNMYIISLYTIWSFYTIDRDIQCDFNNQFWEVTDCNWVQDEVQVENYGLGEDFHKRFTRSLATTEHKAGNYWKRETSYTGKFFESLECKKNLMF